MKSTTLKTKPKVDSLMYKVLFKVSNRMVQYKVLLLTQPVLRVFMLPHATGDSSRYSAILPPSMLIGVPTLVFLECCCVGLSVHLIH